MHYIYIFFFHLVIEYMSISLTSLCPEEYDGRSDLNVWHSRYRFLISPQARTGWHRVTNCTVSGSDAVM